ncbi:MAG: fibronectin type III domain-containing protein [Paludibacter sp.]
MKKITILFAVLLMVGMVSNVSAQTVLSTPTVGTASRPTLTGFTANWTAVANATSYAINVYDGASALVTGSPKTVTGASSATLAITGMLLPNTSYTYTVTAIGDGVTYLSSAASANSALLTTATSTGTYTLQYAEADVATLNNDLIGGAADIYELTTSGGAYTFNTGSTNNNTLTKNTTIRAAAGLANRPVLKLNSVTTGATACIIYTLTPNLTIKLDGLEFNGINAGGTGQPLAFSATAAAINTKLYVTNCYFHDMLNVPGNGTIRMDGINTSGVLDIQGSIFNNCGGRVIYQNAAANTPNSVTLINIKNCTFSNIVALTSRANVVYNSLANNGTQTYDHCTFYNIATSTTSPIYVKALGGAVLIKNSLFSSVLLTQPLTFTTTITDCYVGGLATAPAGTSTAITGTITTVPAYTDASLTDNTKINFALTNKTSFLATTDGLVAGNTIYYSALPKLDSPVLGTASSIGTNGFTANWSTVTNSSGGYSVKVYEGGVTLVNTTPVIGQTSTSVAITGLKTGTTYKYTVTAVGDATNYDNSNPSDASASFTTLGLAVPVVGTASGITSSSFTANWTPVANAISYNVLTYLTSVLVSTTNVSGQASTNISITGLAMGTTYTYKVVAVGDGVTYTNSDASSASAIAKTLAVSVSSLNPNFSDGTWGLVTVSTPALGAYPVFSANGWDLTHAQVKLNLTIGIKGEPHSNVIMMDKTSNSGVLLTPVVTSAAEIEIHSAASVTRQYLIQSSIDAGATWQAVGPGNLNGGVGSATAGTYYNNSAGLEQIDIIPTGGLTNAQYKITDPSSGAFTFYSIISRTTVTSTTALAIPTGSIAASSASSTGFTANWTNTVANATGYKVNVYSNKMKTLVTTATVSNSSALTLNITGLQADSTYLYGVVGLGDNITYSDGYILMGTSPVITNMAAPVASAATNISTSGFTANWASVNNASSYDVKVYDSNLNQVGTTTNVLTGTLNLPVTGLNSNASYTYTVTAKGDAALHFDSAPSAAIAVSTTITSFSSLKENTYLTTINKTIISPELGLLQVYNLQGAQVLQVQNTNNVNTNLATGLYVARFTNNLGKQIVQKITIK